MTRAAFHKGIALDSGGVSVGIVGYRGVSLANAALCNTTEICMSRRNSIVDNGFANVAHRPGAAEGSAKGYRGGSAKRFIILKGGTGPCLRHTGSKRF